MFKKSIFIFSILITTPYAFGCSGCVDDNPSIFSKAIINAQKAYEKKLKILIENLNKNLDTIKEQDNKYFSEKKMILKELNLLKISEIKLWNNSMTAKNKLNEKKEEVDFASF